ncbi:MAG: helix-turn-helix domain-containing protein [Lachnospiraceae bacterium]|nr:helix-turn-helix domain-containing protein [Lachnospiraceae bacterium]
MNKAEKQRLSEALSAAGFDKEKVEQLESVLRGDMSAQDWAAGTSSRDMPFSRSSVYLLRLQPEAMEESEAMLKELYEEDSIRRQGQDSLLLIHSLRSEKDRENHAQHILSTVNTELMEKIRIAIGGVADSPAELEECTRQAFLAMEVMECFYGERLIMDYASLGLGGLIRDLSPLSCERFLEECFGTKKHSRLDEEELQTVSRFLEHDLNISETARDLFLHRNTLVYHLEKIQKKTGLDIRHFDQAMKLKLALMIEVYLEHR